MTRIQLRLLAGLVGLGWLSGCSPFCTRTYDCAPPASCGVSGIMGGNGGISGIPCGNSGMMDEGTFQTIPGGQGMMPFQPQMTMPPQGGLMPSQTGVLPQLQTVPSNGLLPQSAVPITASPSSRSH
jgi:hypothetical protein